MYLVLLLFAGFASVFTISKAALTVTSPLFLVGFRMLVAGIMLLSYQLLIKGERLRLKKTDLKKIALFALFGIYLTNTLEFWGLKYLTSSKTCFLYSLTPFASAFLAYLILNERMNAKKWIGLVIGFIGISPIFLINTGKEEMAKQIWIFSLPELAVLAAVFFSVYGWIVLKQIAQESGLSLLTANSLSMCLGGALALIHSFFVEEWNPLPITDPKLFLYLVSGLMLVSNFFCYNLYGYLLKRYSATFMAFAGLTTPLFAFFFGWLFLSETIALPFYFSILLLFSGLVLFYQEELKQSYQLTSIE